MNVNKDLLRLGILALFLFGILAIAWMGGYLTGRTIYVSPFQDDLAAEEMGSVSQILQELPLDKTVSVDGTVSRILSDYTSKKGYQYQQFYITDGSKELKIFCSKYKGSIDIQKSDNVSVTGKFQKYSNTYEIYSECGNVEVLNQ
ncbi:MAG: hypothetical protein MUP55_01320 [Candidatus Aenigmarchaeota archaeon]|nr:hypothetical protein [Candidatus Aenigmarchaeota archaeon]